MATHSVHSPVYPPPGKLAIQRYVTLGRKVVPRTGIEPVRLSAGGFKPPTSTNFVTRANFVVWHSPA